MDQALSEGVNVEGCPLVVVDGLGRMVYFSVRQFYYCMNCTYGKMCYSSNC